VRGSSLRRGPHTPGTRLAQAWHTPPHAAAASSPRLASPLCTRAPSTPRHLAQVPQRHARNPRLAARLQPYRSDTPATPDSRRGCNLFPLSALTGHLTSGTQPLAGRSGAHAPALSSATPAALRACYGHAWLQPRAPRLC